MTYRNLNVKPETFKLVVKDCIAEFRRNHPEFEGKKVSQDHIIRQIARFYLEFE